MDLSRIIGIHKKINLLDSGKIIAPPSWVNTLFWLGWWCRTFKSDSENLITVAVIPTTELASVFAGLGCLIAGAQQFEGGFSWSDLCCLSVGSKVFWRDEKGRRNEGVLIQNDNPSPKMVCIKPIKGPSTGLTSWYITEDKFRTIKFSEDQIPTPKYTLSMENGLRFYEYIGIENASQWIWDGNREAIVSTNQTRFFTAAESLSLVLEEDSSVSLVDALCIGRSNENRTSKLLLTPTYKATNNVAPLYILDGKDALCQLEEVDNKNVLILLDRTEYSAEIHNILLEASNQAVKPKPEFLGQIPNQFPPGFDLCAYILPKG